MEWLQSLSEEEERKKIEAATLSCEGLHFRTVCFSTANGVSVCFPSFLR